MDSQLPQLPVVGQAESTPCDDCHGGCCRSFAVAINGADIWRIERDLKLSFWDFVCRWEDPEGQIAQKYAPHFFFQEEPNTPFVICLTHERSHFLPGSSKCRFLREGQPDAEHPLGVGRCGIYHSRPGTCRVFPTKFNPTRELAMIVDVPLEAAESEHPAYNLCPRAWETSDLDPINTLEHLSYADFEMQFFHKVAALWNRRPGSWTIFPDFLKLVYSERIIHGEKVVEDEMMAETVKFPGPEEREETRRAA